MNNILNEIKINAEEGYGDFTAKLIPTLPREKILGVRAPNAKKIAKAYAKDEAGKSFLASLPHTYHDEYMVHAYMLGYLRLPFEEMKAQIAGLLPYVDNWAVCDSLCASIKHFFGNRDLALDFLTTCLKSGEIYTVRFGLVCLLDYYIDKKYIATLVSLVGTVKSEEYYVNMALAWLVSIMLIKEYEKTLPLILSGALDVWVHNKAISKFCESHQPSSEEKSYLKSLRR